MEQYIDYRFVRHDLLGTALTHRSVGTPHNERLEFLGDGVLNCVIADLLFDRFPELDEGALSRLRANLVRQETLVRVAANLNLGAHLRLGDGERKSGGHTRPSILADAVEAIVGAVYLDGGFDAAKKTVARLFAPLMADIDPTQTSKDAKTRLQEFLQGRRMPLPVYSLVSVRGEAHLQEFDVRCEVAKLGVFASGVGSSRKIAEQRAAEAVLEIIERDPSP